MPDDVVAARASLGMAEHQRVPEHVVKRNRFVRQQGMTCGDGDDRAARSQGLTDEPFVARVIYGDADTCPVAAQYLQHLVNRHFGVPYFGLAVFFPLASPQG